ncbi:MAG: ArsR family transcriptional regulator [Candidatus Hydrothermarchaeales archaeon]
MGFDEMLKILGNETRRDILQMLATSPCYVSQLSEELHIGQKAIIQHLELMRTAGILASRYQKIEKGRPRKYFTITRDFVIEVNVGSNLFDIEMDSPHINESVLDDYPKLKEISEELRVAGSLQGRVKILKLDEIYQKLADERANITEIRKAIDYLMGDIRGIIQEEVRGDEVRRQIPR